MNKEKIALRIRLHVSPIMYVFGVAGNIPSRICRHRFYLCISVSPYRNISRCHGMDNLPSRHHPARSLHGQLQWFSWKNESCCSWFLLALLQYLVVGHHDHLFQGQLMGLILIDYIILMTCILIRGTQKTHCLNVNTVEELRRALFKIDGIPTSLQKIYHGHHMISAD